MPASNTLLVTAEEAADHETTGESITLSFRRYQILSGFAPELHATVRSLPGGTMGAKMPRSSISPPAPARQSGHAPLAIPAGEVREVRMTLERG